MSDCHSDTIQIRADSTLYNHLGPVVIANLKELSIDREGSIFYRWTQVNGFLCDTITLTMGYRYTFLPIRYPYFVTLQSTVAEHNLIDRPVFSSNQGRDIRR